MRVFNVPTAIWVVLCLFSVATTQAEDRSRVSPQGFHPGRASQSLSREWLVLVQPGSPLERSISQSKSGDTINSEASANGASHNLKRSGQNTVKLIRSFKARKTTKSTASDLLAILEAQETVLEALMKSGQILHIEDNRAFKPVFPVTKSRALNFQGQSAQKNLTTNPNDPHWDRQWHLRRVGFDQVWTTVPELVSTRSRALIFVADTWIDTEHPEFQATQFVDSQPLQSHWVPFHGTHVAGIISAWTGNQRGIAAPLWDAEIVPLDVCGVTDCDTMKIVEAIYKSADFQADRMEHGQPIPRVLNLSLGGTNYSFHMARAIEYAQSKNVLIIAAAGNSRAPALAFYPASYPEVLSVGATDEDDKLAWFSNWGPRSLSIVAPGTGILSTVPTGSVPFLRSYEVEILDENLAFLDGTSMAAPLVTAAAAMVRAFRPDLSSHEIAKVLRESGHNIPAEGFEGLHYKRLDVPAAVERAALASNTERAANTYAEDVLVDASRTCHIGYDPSKPCENCIVLHAQVGAVDGGTTRIRWMSHGLLPFPDSLHFTEVRSHQSLEIHVPYLIPEPYSLGWGNIWNFHFLTGFIEDRDQSGEVRALRPIRFSSGENFFDIGRTPCR